MLKRKRILYLMHIDWNWIKQRPQYIEEELEKKFDVTVFCPRNYRLKEYHDKENVVVFYTIPFIRRFKGIWKIDSFRKKIGVNSFIKNLKPDIIYCTAPEYASTIPASYKGRVVYDCMDDMLAFNSRSHFIDRVAKQEKSMVARAEIVLSTSERLKQILEIRYPEATTKIHLVRNGYDGNIASPQKKVRKEKYTLCYFGTISHWFNFDYIIKSLNDVPDLQYLLIGPVEAGTIIPTHERLLYQPSVKHDELAKETQQADGFIMPFEINDLILSVDPVKLYEYINFGKNILCVEYPEIRRFAPFVYFYADYDSFHDQINRMKLANERKYSEESRLFFLKENDWKHRVDSIVALLNYC